jgi:hypothetical protein
VLKIERLAQEALVELNDTNAGIRVRDASLVMYRSGILMGLELAAKALDDVGDSMAAELVRGIGEEQENEG